MSSAECMQAQYAHVHILGVWCVCGKFTLVACHEYSASGALFLPVCHKKLFMGMDYIPVAFQSLVSLHYSIEKWFFHRFFIANVCSGFIIICCVR